MSDLAALLAEAQAHFAAQRFQEAAAAYSRAAPLAPQDWTIAYHLGLCLTHLGQPELALQTYQLARRLAPRQVPVLSQLAATAFAQGDWALAQEATLEQIGCTPEDPLAYDNLGLIFQRQGLQEAALLAFQNAHLLAPDLPGPLLHLSQTHLALGQAAEASALLTPRLPQHPEHPGLRLTLAQAALAREELEEAESWARQALPLAQGDGNLLLEIGLLFKSLARYDLADQAETRALALTPQNPRAHWNHALTQLVRGHWPEAWAEYEWGPTVGTRSGFSNRLPRWQGQPLEGRSLLLRSEQGLGDTLQFLRFAPWAQAQGGQIVLECAAPLAEIAATAPGIHRVVIQQPDLPADGFGCDLYAPIMGLPHLMGLTLGQLPGCTFPYLTIPAPARERWEHQLPGSKPKVGLVWAGNPRHPNDSQRSCPPQALAPLLVQAGVDFYSFQVDQEIPEELPGLRPLPLSLQSFSDSAAALSQLDLLISVDTSMVHLAGALNLPTWLLLPYNGDWRWLENRTDSPWYPSLRIYRQKMPGQWLPLAETLVRGLNQRFSG
ncbi:tetratricopeptide repeat protein [Azospira inquinata]|uniref:Tetratricopeptide repeat protein n=1 Tax=Azospira inquinata TaxID=2785627 RepID=A0A975XU65_9RHOO|nr:tetratricopeptide repeat protein [Azospira inquinata]QWT46238.1 tetratricopeptide repeat protein [Azospira inquinata]QWT48435.1 tetratricopeptide repeat protein [Azospira inquinata]